MVRILSIKDLASHYCVEATKKKEMKALIKKRLYRNTSCGAWIDFITPLPSGTNRDGEMVSAGNMGGVMIGSIVEGAEQCTDAYTLMYPFSVEELEGAIKQVEDEAKAIWNDTHGCDDCGVGEGETGYPMVNPECKSCEGHGAII